MGFRPDDVIAGQRRFQKAALTRPRVPLPVGIGHAVQQDRGRAQSVRPDDVNAKTVDRAGAGKSNEMVARTRPPGRRPRGRTTPLADRLSASQRSGERGVR